MNSYIQANTTSNERQQRRECDHINAAQRRSAARQSTHDLQRHVITQFRQSIYTGPFNPCYCCSHLCYNNDGSFIDANDPLFLPIHDRELSELVRDSGNPVWICLRCKTSLRKRKLPPFALVNNMHVPPFPPSLAASTAWRSN